MSTIQLDLFKDNTFELICKRNIREFISCYIGCDGVVHGRIITREVHSNSALFPNKKGKMVGAEILEEGVIGKCDGSCNGKIFYGYFYLDDENQ